MDASVDITDTGYKNVTTMSQIPTRAAAKFGTRSEDENLDCKYIHGRESFSEGI